MPEGVSPFAIDTILAHSWWIREKNWGIAPIACGDDSRTLLRERGDIFTPLQIQGHQTLKTAKRYVNSPAGRVGVQHQRSSPIKRIDLGKRKRRIRVKASKRLVPASFKGASPDCRRTSV